jgi:hypothetical protein
MIGASLPTENRDQRGGHEGEGASKPFASCTCTIQVTSPLSGPGETEAGSAGTQPCRGIARWGLIASMRRGAWGPLASTLPPNRDFAPPKISSNDRPPYALKIHPATET